MKYIIAGRVGSGKTTLAKRMEMRGLRIAKSFTTRPRRPGEDDDYLFISQEEADKYPPSERVVATSRQEYEYFMSRDEVLRSDIFVVDPNGVRDLAKEFPNEQFVLIYVRPASVELAQRFHDNRDPGGKSFAERSAAEDKLFTAFEQNLMRKDFRTMFAGCYNILNNYNGGLTAWAKRFTEED